MDVLIYLLPLPLILILLDDERSLVYLSLFAIIWFLLLSDPLLIIPAALIVMLYAYLFSYDLEDEASVITLFLLTLLIVATIAILVAGLTGSFLIFLPLFFYYPSKSKSDELLALSVLVTLTLILIVTLMSPLIGLQAEKFALPAMGLALTFGLSLIVHSGE